MTDSVEVYVDVGGSREDEVEALMACAADFRLDAAEARAVIGEVLAATGAWRQVAAANGVRAGELAMFEPALEGLRSTLAAA